MHSHIFVGNAVVRTVQARKPRWRNLATNSAAEGPAQAVQCKPLPSGRWPGIEPGPGAAKKSAPHHHPLKTLIVPSLLPISYWPIPRESTVWQRIHLAKFISVQLFQAYAILDYLAALTWGGFLKSCLNSVPCKAFLHVCSNVPRNRRAILQEYSNFLYSQVALCYRFLWQEIPVICWDTFSTTKWKEDFLGSNRNQSHHHLFSKCIPFIERELDSSHRQTAFQ